MNQALPNAVLPRLALPLVLLGLILQAACAQPSSPGFTSDVESLLTRGRDYAGTLSNIPADRLSDREVVALGYLERSRLGMGSPFRLVEYVRRDDRLDPVLARTLSYAILAEALDGGGYAVDPLLLNGVRLTGVGPRVRSGPHHLGMIARMVAEAPTATAGERAIRMGYGLAYAERSVRGLPESVVAHVGALVADRRRAREDAEELLRFASSRSMDPLEVMSRWRRERRLRVEQPAISALTPAEQVAEAELGIRIARDIRLMGHRLSGPVSLGRSRQREVLEERHSRLSPEVARRLSQLARQHDYPPQSPAAVAVLIHRGAFLGHADADREQRSRRERFLDAAWNEERLVSGAAALRESDDVFDARLSLILVQAAVFTRAWNQETPWMPGDPAPAQRDLEVRFGLAGIGFGSEVPDAWRPYYLGMLSSGLSDLRRILPTASLRGLRIHVGDLQPGFVALALHDPRSRTLYLPPRTGMGTLAHEIGHDLDWQLGRRRYGRSGYATDLAVQRGRGDRIAASLSGLASSLVRAPEDSIITPHDTRPTEVFARGLDWFVAAAMARDGRTGGYLTSFQDPALTGYGSARGPDVGGGAPASLLAILDHIAPVTPDLREWALGTYGPGRRVLADEVVRAVVRAGVARYPEARFMAVEEARDRALRAIGREQCRAASVPGETSRLDNARRSLVQFATEAAVRGAVADGVRRLAALVHPDMPVGAVDAWLAWRYYGAPQPADPELDDLLPGFEGLLARADQALLSSAEPAGSPFRIPAAPVLCGANPFATGALF